MNVGAVAGLRNIRDAIAVARHVMENTKHTLLVGDLASDFAVQMGFKRESLATLYSAQVYNDWKQHNCQPNFWIVRALYSEIIFLKLYTRNDLL